MIEQPERDRGVEARGLIVELRPENGSVGGGRRVDPSRHSVCLHDNPRSFERIGNAVPIGIRKTRIGADVDLPSIGQSVEIGIGYGGTIDVDYLRYTSGVWYPYIPPKGTVMMFR